MKHYVLEQINATNNHSIIFGDKQSGKTFAAKIEIMRSIKEDKKVFVFDFKDKYQAICNQYNGNKITISDSKMINIFDFLPSEIEDIEYYQSLFVYRILKVLDFLKILLNRELSQEENKAILNYLEDYYQSLGITRDKYEPKASVPSLKSFIKFLKTRSKKLHRELIPYFNEFSSNSQVNLFENQLNVISFNISKLNPNIQNSILYSLLILVRVDNVNIPPYALVIFDDVLPFLKKEEAHNLLVMHLKTAKKFNTSYIFIAESITEFIKCNGEAILGNINTSVFLRQNSNDFETIFEYYNHYLDQSRFRSRLDQMPLGYATIVNYAVCDVYIRPYYEY